MLFTIVPTKLITKLRTLWLNTSLINWILDFLTGRPQFEESLKFLSVHITNELSWSKHTKTVEGTTTPFPLRRLKRFGIGPQILKRSYSCIIESILTGCITAWYGNCSASDPKVLQRVVRTTSTSLGPSFLTCRTYVLGAVRGRHPKNSKTPVTQVIDCSLCYRTASSTGAPSLGPKGSLTASTTPS